MGSFKENFQKQGGMKLIKEWWRAGVLGYAVGQLLLTGKSKKGLEILRLGVKMKIYNKLNKQYKPVLQRFDKAYSPVNLVQQKSNKVWVFWLQGMENAPALVKKCYQSLHDNLKDREIILITQDNMKDYVQFPSYIEEKVKSGVITITHLSDLLRIELLCKYGGTWVDATVLCTGGNIPNYMMDSDLFCFQNLRPGDNGSAINVSSWFMTACSNNKILLGIREMFFEYWKTHDYLIDYFLYHNLIMVAANYYKEDWAKIVQFPNSFPHVLLLMLFDEFNQEKWDAVTSVCPFHKLAYKRSAEEMAKPNTYYQYIMNHG